MFLMALQILVFQRWNIGGPAFNYISVFLYPVFLIWLPIGIPRTVQLLIGFGTGIIVDFFYNTNGLHASACVFIMFIRPVILNLLSPPSGYTEMTSLTRRNYSTFWFGSYAVLFMLLFLLWYFSVEAFTFVHFAKIIKKTLGSFAASFSAIVMYQLLFDPKT
jgi:hypothetical protein